MMVTLWVFMHSSPALSTSGKVWKNRKSSDEDATGTFNSRAKGPKLKATDVVECQITFETTVSQWQSRVDVPLVQ